MQFYQNAYTFKKETNIQDPLSNLTNSNVTNKNLYNRINSDQNYWSSRVYKFLSSLTEIKSWPKDEKNCNNYSLFL